MAKRRYSDEDRAMALAALAANGGNLKRTAREQGVPETSLRQWAKGDRHPEAVEMSAQKKPPLADAYEDVVRRSLGHLSEAKLKRAGAVDLLKVAGIATDKMRLLRDEPTSITGHQDEFFRQLDRLAQRHADAARRAIAADGAAGEDGDAEPVHPPRDGDGQAE